MGNSQCLVLIQNDQEHKKQQRIQLNLHKIQSRFSGLGQVFINPKNNLYQFVLQVKGMNQFLQGDIIKVEIPIIDNFVQTSRKNVKAEFTSYQIIEDSFQDKYANSNERKSCQQAFRVCDNFSKKHYLMKVFNFESYQDYEFKKGLLEIFLLNQLKAQNCIYISNIQFYYIKEWQSQSNNQQKTIRTLILLYEPADINLQSIIKFRNYQNEWYWSEYQQEQIAFSLIKALKLLNQNKFIHRDIRPNKIYYSLDKKCYVLGGFDDMLFTKTENITLQLSGVPLFCDKQIKKLLLANENQKKKQFQAKFLMDNDCYSVSMCLKAVQNLVVHPNANHNGRLSRIIKDLQQHRQLSVILKERFAKFKPQGINQDNLIQSMFFYLRNNASFVYRTINKKTILYYLLGDVQRFTITSRDAIQLEMGKGNFFQSAKLQYKLGIFFSKRNKQVSEKFLFEAFKFFSKQSQKLKDLKMAISCSQYLPIEMHIQVLTNLIDFYIDSMDYERARPQLLKVINLSSTQTVNQSLQIKILSLYALLMVYDGNIKEALRIAKKATEIQSSEVYDNVRCLETLAEIYRAKSRQAKAKQQNLIIRKSKIKEYNQKSEFFLLQAMQTLEKEYGSGHFLVHKTLSIMGNLQFEMRNYQKAYQSYQRELIVITSTKPNNNILLGIVYMNMGNALKCMNKLQQGKYQQIAMEAYQLSCMKFKVCEAENKRFLQGVSIGNQGIILKQMNEKQKSQKCLLKAIEIMDQQETQQDKQFFMNHLKQL